MQNGKAVYCHSADDSTSSALLAGAQRYDQAAWEEIVDRYSALVYHWCRRSGLCPEDSADVLQSVMLKLSQRLHRFQNDGQPAAFRRWLATVTRNCIRDLARANQDQVPGLGGTDAIVLLRQLQAASDVDDSSAVKARSRIGELAAVLAEVEQSVEPTTWNAFRLMVFENLSSPEAAAQLKISSAAVRLAKARVLQRLRIRLGDRQRAVE